MRTAKTLRSWVEHVERNESGSEAIVGLKDGSRLCFCHRVGERWAKAIGPDEERDETGVAGKILAAISMFRLNTKHLDVEFGDGSRWEECL